MYGRPTGLYENRVPLKIQVVYHFSSISTPDQKARFINLAGFPSKYWIHLLQKCHSLHLNNWTAQWFIPLKLWSPILGIPPNDSFTMSGSFSNSFFASSASLLRNMPLMGHGMFSLPDGVLVQASLVLTPYSKFTTHWLVLSNWIGVLHGTTVLIAKIRHSRVSLLLAGPAPQLINQELTDVRMVRILNKIAIITNR